MAATGTPTPNIGLRIPVGTDPASVDDINYNSNLIDTKLGPVGSDSVQDQIDALNSRFATVAWTPVFGRDTISELYDSYAVRSGDIVQCRCRFKLAAHNGGSSYLDASSLPKFGKTPHFSFGVWEGETNDKSGGMHGSNNNNIWFEEAGIHISLGNYVGQTIWLGFAYTLS